LAVARVHDHDTLTPNPKSQTLHPKPYTLHPKSSSLIIPTPHTLFIEYPHLKPQSSGAAVAATGSGARPRSTLKTRDHTPVGPLWEESHERRGCLRSQHHISPAMLVYKDHRVSRDHALVRPNPKPKTLGAADGATGGGARPRPTLSTLTSQP